jgi:hypothetical protein
MAAMPIGKHEAKADKADKYCSACYTSGPHLKRCSACKKAYYCDEWCQGRDRPLHRIKCAADKPTPDTGAMADLAVETSTNDEKSKPCPQGMQDKQIPGMPKTRSPIIGVYQFPPSNGITVHVAEVGNGSDPCDSDQFDAVARALYKYQLAKEWLTLDDVRVESIFTLVRHDMQHTLNCELFGRMGPYKPSVRGDWDRRALINALVGDRLATAKALNVFIVSLDTYEVISVMIDINKDLSHLARLFWLLFHN